MPRCDRCREVVAGSDYYRCTYCGSHYCGTHQLPENHGCQYAGQIDPPWESKLDEDTKYRPTVGRVAHGEGRSPRPNRTDRSRTSQSAAVTQTRRTADPRVARQRSRDATPAGSTTGEETAQSQASSDGVLAVIKKRLRGYVNSPLGVLTFVILSGVLVYDVYVLLF
jgi:hypothetical protein